jgi:type VI protein secretion system component Hcp
LIAGSAVLALAAGIGSQLVAGQAAGAVTTTPFGSSATVDTAQGPLAGDNGNTFSVSSYQWSLTEKLSGSMPTGRPTVGDLTFTHPVGMGSLSLAKAMADNQTLTKVTLVIAVTAHSGATNVTVPAYRYALSNCVLVELNNTGSSGAPTEQVKVHCTKVLLQVPPGAPGGPASGAEVEIQNPVA